LPRCRGPTGSSFAARNGRRADLFSKHEAILCDGDAEKYEPLKDEPTAYLEFGRACSLSRDEADFTERAVEFVKRFGLPWRLPACDERYGTPGIPLESFRADGQELSRAIELLIASNEVQRGGDSIKLAAVLDQGRGREVAHVLAETLGRNAALVAGAVDELSLTLTWHLQGIRLLPLLDIKTLLDYAMSGKSRRGHFPPSVVRLGPQYACDSLLSAMWLQVYVAATEQRIVRGRCKGCARPFEAKDRRQQYCDAHCRHATNQRSYYYSEKEKRRRQQDEQARKRRR